MLSPNGFIRSRKKMVKGLVVLICYGFCAGIVTFIIMSLCVPSRFCREAAGAMVLVFAGCFHAAGYRQLPPVVFLLFGCACSLMLLPFFIEDPKRGLFIADGIESVRGDIAAWIAYSVTCSVLAMGVALVRRKMLVRREERVGRICLRCGYDLRASKYRCPECGEIFEAPVQPATQPGN